MQRHPDDPSIVWFDPDDVRDMLMEKIRAAGISVDPLAFQIVVNKPFGAGKTVHAEVPTLVVILQKGQEG